MVPNPPASFAYAAGNDESHAAISLPSPCDCRRTALNATMMLPDSKGKICEHA
jgi:hypothetical protein